MRKFVILAALCAAGALYAADKIVGGPYVTNLTGKSAAVTWVVQDAEVALSAAGGAPKSAPALRARSVSFAGLKPGTVYEYSIPGEADAKGHFKTPPAGAAPFQCVVFGDTRTRHELHQKVVDALMKDAPDFVVHTGDLVSDGADVSMWPIFFGIEKELLRSTVLFPVLGNHERNSRHFYEFFGITTPFYSFDWGTAHFTLLNSDYGNAAASKAAKEAFWEEQTRWLEEDLAAAGKAEFRFVVMHHPPFTAVKKRQPGDSHTAGLVPLFEKYGVRAVFMGHDHNYQHHRRNGVDYFVTGGGGAPLYPVDAPIEGTTLKVESTEHYLRLKVENSQAVVEAIALDGHTIDRVELAAVAAASN